MLVKIIGSQRFKAIVSAYGANPDRWPAYERAAALEFCRKSPQKANQMMREAQEVDSLLGFLKAPQASEALHWQTLGLLMPQGGGAAVLPFTPRSTLKSPFVWMTGASLAAACAAGIILGMSLSLHSIVDQRVQDVLVQTSIVDLEN
ncbi:hypothetical protein [Asticcacaulis endophyticus]|uniref:Uncharacterized protein n=1 Tax=Asticcacaulis endophyticus TaxID=1395890 RepID=A0A918QFC7_9CAUL|nr:hypothetical protein [Asticcacaulis endophyticus]GGZ45869.1 hypothetical protein GCM10011273_35610 [Asticcacaulis endophyticus]